MGGKRCVGRRDRWRCALKYCIGPQPRWTDLALRVEVHAGAHEIAKHQNHSHAMSISSCIASYVQGTYAQTEHVPNSWS